MTFSAYCKDKATTVNTYSAKYLLKDREIVLRNKEFEIREDSENGNRQEFIDIVKNLYPTENEYIINGILKHITDNRDFIRIVDVNGCDGNYKIFLKTKQSPIKNNTVKIGLVSSVSSMTRYFIDWLIAKIKLVF